MPEAPRARPPAGDDYVCPFCGEGDFDAYGLKIHLRLDWCEAWCAVTEDDRLGNPALRVTDAEESDNG